MSCYKSTSTSLIQSPAISTTQTHTPGLFSTSLIQSPTISITQTHTPSVSVNRSKIFALPQPPTPMIRTPHISVSQASGQKSSVPLSRIGASQPVSSSTQASPSVVTSGSSLNNLLSTLVSQILAHPMAQNSSASVASPLQNPQSTVPHGPQSYSAPKPSTSRYLVGDDAFWQYLPLPRLFRENSARGDGKPLPPPDDLVVQHKEYVLLQNPKSGIFQLSRELRNVLSSLLIMYS